VLVDGTRRVRVGCNFRYECSADSPASFQVQPSEIGAHVIVSEEWHIDPPLARRSYFDVNANRCQWVNLPPGISEVTYRATVDVPDRLDDVDLDAVQQPVGDLPPEALLFTLPSRYCLSDVLAGEAWTRFGQTSPGYRRVQEICDFVHGHLHFRYGSTSPATTSVDAYRSAEGVCRDFTHLAITFCRALNVPARYVFGYLPDIAVTPPEAPMDFCAWFEAYLGGRWWTFDPRNNEARVGRIVIGRGRDALDVAMVTTFGAPRLDAMTVWADEVL
jgi:transglutaminase-like putative cysteine protease